MIVLDSTFLILLIDPQAPTPIDPITQKAIPNGRERIETLIADLAKANERIGIPTPALSEVMVRIPQHIPTLIAELNATYRLKILPFDEMAAVEVALMSERGGRASESNDDAYTKAQLKYDRQIIGIAKATKSRAIYSDDRRLCQKARTLGIHAWGLESIALPPAASQITLALPEPGSEPPPPPRPSDEVRAVVEAAVNPVLAGSDVPPPPLEGGRPNQIAPDAT